MHAFNFANGSPNLIFGIPKFEEGDLVMYRLSKNQNALGKEEIMLTIWWAICESWKRAFVTFFPTSGGIALRWRLVIVAGKVMGMFVVSSIDD